MPGREAEQVQEAAPEPAKASLALAPAMAGNDVQARFLTLARAVGNRAATRLLQRWRDEAGKWHDGAKPPDADNWEQFTSKDGQLRWKRKATAPVVAVVAVAAAAPVPGNDPVADAAGRLWLDPMKIRYSQDSIDGTFSTGGKIDDAARDLKRDLTKVGNWPSLNITKRQGRYVSLDNRRLWVFKHAGVALAPVVMATAQEVTDQNWKFTAGSGGAAFIGVRSAISLTNLTPANLPRNFAKKNQLWNYQ